MSEQLLRKTIPWHQVLGGEILHESPFGAEYMVPDFGRVWVGRNDLKEATVNGDDSLCNLVTVSNDGREKIWAIVGFQSQKKADSVTR